MFNMQKTSNRRQATIAHQPALVLVLLLLSLTAACSRGSSNQTNDIRSDDQAFSFVADGPYADVLKQCTLVGLTTDSCKLTTLPFIASAPDEVPSVEQIMQRVLVTHNWMGERFNELLRNLPEDIRYLFGSVTVVYIGSNVRPSFYSTLNGAIHLDPAVLWLTNDEKSAISREDDYRSSFGAGLSFDFYQRFVNDQGHAWRYFSLDSPAERTLDDILQPVARLLFHELAHVNDFMPATQRSAVDTGLSVYAAIESVRNAWLSPRLHADYPLSSTLLTELASVRYRGLTPSGEQATVSADVAGAQMEADGALYFYGYSARAEDLAGLFVAAMMKIHYDVEVDTAYVVKPVGSSAGSCFYEIGWGQHNRLGNTLVAARSKFVVDAVMGQQSRVDDFFTSSTGEAVNYSADQQWCDSLKQGL